MLKTFDLNILAEFSSKQDLLNTPENRRKIKKDILKTNNYNVVLICLEAGQEIPPRPEQYSVCFYIIEGKGTFTVGSEQVELGRGCMIFVPADESRGIKSKEKLTLIGIQDPH